MALQQPAWHRGRGSRPQENCSAAEVGSNASDQFAGRKLGMFGGMHRGRALRGSLRYVHCGWGAGDAQRVCAEGFTLACSLWVGGWGRADKFHTCNQCSPWGALV
eukprot:scaffold88732_cov21-Tisochrysis_lutea.AAC.1